VGRIESLDEVVRKQDFGPMYAGGAVGDTLGSVRFALLQLKEQQAVSSDEREQGRPGPAVHIGSELAASRAGVAVRDRGGSKIGRSAARLARRDVANRSNLGRDSIDNRG